MKIENVSIAPLVLVSVVDHYKRVSTERVVGILLGNIRENTACVTNSFAIPFDESVEGVFLDTSYLQNMYDLYNKVNSKEEILGWYHSGPNMYSSDLEIMRVMMGYCQTPVLAVVNVHKQRGGIPCEAYGMGSDRRLVRKNVEVLADEIEEVGVEHLLRDIKEGTGSTLKDEVAVIIESLWAYEDLLRQIIEYFEKVQTGKRRNKVILNALQDVLNSVPRYRAETNLGSIYVAKLAEAFRKMNDLQKNKIERKQW